MVRREFNMYYYLHVNGEVIYKPNVVVDMGGGPEMYFEGPFVQKWWKITDLDDLDRMVDDLREYGVDEGTITSIELFFNEQTKRRTEIRD